MDLLRESIVDVVDFVWVGCAGAAPLVVILLYAWLKPDVTDCLSDSKWFPCCGSGLF